MMSATISHTEKKKLLVPKLRFKGFEDEWNAYKLSSFINFISGYAFNSSEMKSTKSRYQLIKMSNVYKNELDLDRNPSYWDKIDAKTEKFLLKKKDILLTLTGTVGKQDYGYSVVIPEGNKFLLNQRLVCLRFIPNKSEGDFINNLIKTSRFYYLFFGESKGGTGNQTNVGSEDLKNIKLNIPTLPEQQKIASFLSTVDEKIQQLTRKKELLEQYKKGVMQQLFSGKLRFKDENGKAFPKWEEKLYGDVYSFYSTNSFSRDNLNYESGSVKNIHYGDIHTKFTTLFDVTKETVPFINSEIDISRINEDNYCKEGDLVIADASEDYADIGKSIELVNLNNEKLIAGLHTFLARPNKIKMYKGFSGFLVKAPYVRKQIMTIAQGTKVLSLSTGRLGNAKLNIPCIEEQKKIANYLSNIDNKIESLTKQITQTQTFKKGLLQQMFI